jgi:hypothetical protein
MHFLPIVFAPKTKPYRRKFPGFQNVRQVAKYLISINSRVKIFWKIWPNETCVQVNPDGSAHSFSTIWFDKKGKQHTLYQLNLSQVVKFLKEIPDDRNW